MIVWMAVLVAMAAEPPPPVDPGTETDEPASTEVEAAPADGAEAPAEPPPADPAPPELDDASRVKAAEARRLRGEMVQVAKASRHDAVDRLYRQLVDLDEPIPAHIHGLAGSAARSRGDVMRAVARLHRAEADPEIADLEGRFGAVRLSVPLGATLEGEERFAPDEAAAVAWTRTELAKDGRFVGLLPAGTYQVAGRDVVVPAGGHVAVVVD